MCGHGKQGPLLTQSDFLFIHLSEGEGESSLGKQSSFVLKVHFLLLFCARKEIYINKLGLRSSSICKET